MQSNKIFILDTDQSNTDFFTDHLREDDVNIEVVRTLNEIGRYASEQDFRLAMVNYDTIVEADRSKVVEMFKQLLGHNLIVYNVPAKANRRLAFYDLGASRVYDVSQSLFELCYSLKWLLTSTNEATVIKDQYSAGKLEDIPLTTLIKIFGKENRTGVLKIVTQYNSGKIYFNRGDIDDAQVGFHKSDKAVLHMLFWKTGSFSFNPAESDAPSYEIKMSNIGLLLLAEGLRKEYIVNLEEIGPSTSVVRIKNSGDLKATDTKLSQEFIDFLERPHTLEEVIENPYYTCYETAEILVHLKRTAFLIVAEHSKMLTRDAEEPVEVEIKPEEILELSRDDIEILKRNLNLQNQKNGKLLILGSHTGGKTQVVSALSNSKRAIKSEHGLDIGHLYLNSDIDLLLIGVSISEKAIETIDKLSEGVNGYIFLVDNNKPELFEYTNYLINHLTARNDTPWTIAVTESDDPGVIKSVDTAFNFSVPVDWHICDYKNLESIRNTVLSVKLHEIPKEESEEEEKTEEQEKADS